MADTQATIDETNATNATNEAKPFAPADEMREEPVTRFESDQPVRREISDEEADHHFKAIRELIQNLRNRGDQDNNKVLDNITMHLDVIDPQEEAA